ncbi:MAG: hypothetical protein LBB38_00800 [Puniceicoccales bacterium]|jgi:hypothetical protein|nr:hypothetical protein [Puniceicoccales bacterium]
MGDIHGNYSSTPGWGWYPEEVQSASAKTHKEAKPPQVAHESGPIDKVLIAIDGAKSLADLSAIPQKSNLSIGSILRNIFKYILGQVSLRFTSDIGAAKVELSERIKNLAASNPGLFEEATGAVDDGGEIPNLRQGQSVGDLLFGLTKRLNDLRASETLPTNEKRVLESKLRAAIAIIGDATTEPNDEAVENILEDVVCASAAYVKQELLLNSSRLTIGDDGSELLQNRATTKDDLDKLLAIAKRNGIDLPLSALQW